MSGDDRTNYVYEFTYSSAPGLREIFQCKYVKPNEALNRFRKILALTESPFDFKIVVSDETMGEESSFQVKGGSVEEMFVKFKVFLETSTGFVFEPVSEEITEVGLEDTRFESMSNYDKMQVIIYASFKHGKFSSLDVTEIYQDSFNEDLPKSTASTYLARMWNNGKGHLERYGNRSGYTYRLRTEIAEVQKETERAEELLAAIQMRVRD
ncbi:MAG: hypothetical protein AM326_02075 [Candidatus Thorarchaeota archaeon SMTZ-45]|nr:MAG: hypothetical protein AM325_01180 [Candidatus Thorarchaeota archaeon SMTZ1-45]KXH76699.1 MAG: hypothetical protein AM326_02075 [Candidatus Thorarchaeota archaeon SMTZ-45]